MIFVGFCLIQGLTNFFREIKAAALSTEKNFASWTTALHIQKTFFFSFFRAELLTAHHKKPWFLQIGKTNLGPFLSTLET